MTPEQLTYAVPVPVCCRSAYCKKHMRQYGLEPVGRKCQHEGCTKWAQYTTDGQCKYCLKHCKERNLTPTVMMRVCQQEGCGKYAQRSVDGQCKFCIEHMKVRGRAVGTWVEWVGGWVGAGVCV